jgi:hypothetical protein
MFFPKPPALGSRLKREILKRRDPMVPGNVIFGRQRELPVLDTVLVTRLDTVLDTVLDTL